MSTQDFIKKYCRIIDVVGIKRISLKEKENFDCILWDNGGCTLYEHRPLQCQSYPFWPAHLDSQDSWDSEKQHCPGIGKGKLHARNQIEEWIEKRRLDPYLNTRRGNR